MIATLLHMSLRKHSPFLALDISLFAGRAKSRTGGSSTRVSTSSAPACQLAGIRHVVGSLWEVNHDLCVELARITYQGMEDMYIIDELVCRGLHQATRELRDRWLNVSKGVRSTSKAVQEARVKHEGDSTGARDEGRRDASMPLEISRCTSDDMMHWVPYVHFGV